MRARTGVRIWIAAVLVAAGSVATGAADALGQVANPVYVDDSPAASDTLSRVRDHLASGNLNEAARVLQVLLDEMPHRLVPAGASAGGRGAGGAGGAAQGESRAPAEVKESPAPANDAELVRPVPLVAAGGGLGSDQRDLFRSVRAEANRMLLAAPELMARYREVYEPIARAKLEQGAVEEVERSYLMTTSGFEAGLRLAQRQMEDAEFHAALLTLKQLDAHPDRDGNRGEAAGTLASQLARYVDESAARELASEWKVAATGAPVQWPAGARTRGVTPLEGVVNADLGAVLGKPLRSVAAVDRLVPDMLQALRTVETERLPPMARGLLVMPTVADDILYLNDGLQVTAWDRITLAPRWAVRGDVPAADELVQRAANQRTARGNPAPEDPTVVTVSGRTAVAPLGLAIGSARWPDSRLAAIDTLTGRLKWAVQVEDLDPALEAQSVRGPAVISEGTVVIALRASLPDRRMVTLYQAGMELATGGLKWWRLVGSTGALPYRNDPYVSEAAVLKDGVVYHADMLGVVSATEASTGRPVWLRRVPPLAAQTWDALSPWQIGKPVIDGDSLIVLTPDRRNVMRLDMTTGALRGAASASRFEQQTPRYLVRVGSKLAVVFDNTVALVALNDFERGEVKTMPRIAPPGINGRVSSAGDKLLVPVVEGVLVVDAEAPEVPELMPLDNPGNVLALESQLLVVDDESVHSYLLWDVAERLLTARMAEAPGDPTAAATMAELAYRAGRYERIIGAVDAALTAIARSPESEEAEPTRARLFASLATMVSDAIEPAPTGAVDEDAPIITADALLGDLIDRMRAASRTGDERLTQVLSLGRLLERREQSTAAIDTYQGVLDDDKLSASTWAGPRLSTRGELEVTRRIERLVSEKGQDIYAAHDARASAAAATLGDGAAGGTLIKLATRYPVATVTSQLWERAAEAFRKSGEDYAVVGALESALRAAERIPGAPRVGEVAGKLIAELETRQQFAAAVNALKNVQERHPTAVIAVDGNAVDATQLAARLTDMVAARQRWPRVGAIRREGVQVLSGWTLMEPVMRMRSGVSPRAVVMRSAEHIAMFVPAMSAGAPGSTNSHTAMRELEEGWSHKIDTEMSELLRLDSEAAYFFFASSKGAVIQKVAQSPASVKWETPLFTDVPPRPTGSVARGGTAIARREMETRIPTPQDGLALLTDGLIAMDDRTIVLMERQGHATAVDTNTGAVLWTIRSPLDRTYDAAVSGGTLVIAGDQEVTAGPGERITSLRPEIVVLDARTGQEVQRLGQRWGGVRWIRVTDSAQLIAGCENAITSTDLSRGQVNWVLSDPHLESSRDAWVFEDSIFILDRQRQLWCADVHTGRVTPQALETPGERLEGVRRIEAALLTRQGGDPMVAFMTHKGVVMYDMDGNLKGADSVGGPDRLLPAAPAHDRMIAASAVPEAIRDDRGYVFNLYGFDTTSSMVIDTVGVLLGSPPRAVALIDGRVVLSAGGSSIVLPAPVDP